jgi:CRP-like cAMP-binding protein
MLEMNVFKPETGHKAQHYAFGDMLTSQEREYLVDNSMIRKFENGEVLCRQNRIEDVLYIILMGEVEVVEEVNEERRMTLGKLKSGDLVGEIAALFTVPRIASVYATKTTIVLEIPASAFSGLLKKTPLLSKLVYQKLYERSLETALRCAGKSQKEESVHPISDITRVLSCWQKEHLN